MIHEKLQGRTDLERPPSDISSSKKLTAEQKSQRTLCGTQRWWAINGYRYQGREKRELGPLPIPLTQVTGQRVASRKVFTVDDDMYHYGAILRTQPKQGAIVPCTDPSSARCPSSL